MPASFLKEREFLNLFTPRHLFSSVSLVGVFILLSPAATVNVDQLGELTCAKPFQPHVARNIDFRWMLDVDRWFIPMQSTLNKYRFAETLLEIPMEDLTEDNLAQNASCVTFKWDTAHPTLYGQGDTQVAFMVTPVYENSFGFKGHSATAKRGRSYITLRDNETYVFFTTCWEDEEASWHVISTIKTLPDSVVTDILSHATSLGFKSKHFSAKDCSADETEPEDSNSQTRNNHIEL